MIILIPDHSTRCLPADFRAKPFLNDQGCGFCIPGDDREMLAGSECGLNATARLARASGSACFTRSCTSSRSFHPLSVAGHASRARSKKGAVNHIVADDKATRLDTGILLERKIAFLQIVKFKNQGVDALVGASEVNKAARSMTTTWQVSDFPGHNKVSLGL
jgi:hypothetical protein